MPEKTAFSQPPRKSLRSLLLLLIAVLGAVAALYFVMAAEARVALTNQANTAIVLNTIRARLLPLRILHLLEAIQLQRLRQEDPAQSFRDLASAVDRTDQLHDAFVSGGAVTSITGRVADVHPIPTLPARQAVEEFHQLWYPLREKLERILAAPAEASDELLRETTAQLSATQESFTGISETLTSEAFAHSADELGRLGLRRNLWVSLLAVFIALPGPLFLLLRERRQRTDLESAQSALSQLYADLQRSQNELQNQTRILQSILNSMGDGVAVTNERGEFLLFNPAAEKILGAGAIHAEVAQWPEQYGLYLPDQRTLYPAEQLPLARALHGESVDKAELFMRHARCPEGVWLSVTGRPLTDCAGVAQGGVVVFSDFTARKRAEEELCRLNAELEDKVTERTAQLRAALAKETLLRREIHHRVKNNLQVISSLLFLQSIHTTDAGTLEVLRESQSRTRSLALIHEMLYQSDDLTGVEFAGYIRQLASNMFDCYQVSPSAVRLRIDSDEIYLGLDEAIPCGLIVTELISNALKHAFGTARGGEIGIDFRLNGNGIFHLRVWDSGMGLPAGFDPGKTRTLGLKLVRDLTTQLRGAVEFKNESGAVVNITFPEPKDRATG